MATSLPQFPSFIVHGEGSTSVRWKKWKERLDILLVAMDVIENKERKKALLLHYAGEEVQDVFSTLPLLGPPEGEDLDVYKQATEALQAYFTPKKNREYERYKFRQAKQKEGEDIMTYNTRLRKLGENCEFLDLEEEIKSQIIQSCSSTRLRRRVLRDDDMTLGDILKLARSLELSDEQTKEIENKPEQINTIRRNQGRTRDTKRGNKEKGFTKQNQRHGNGYQKTKDKSAECYRCGGSYPHQGQCPAKGKKCNNCQKLNHFSKMCRSKKKELVHKVEKGANHQYDSSGSDDEYVFHVNTRNAGQPKAAVIIHGMPMDIIVDTGATVNILDEKTFQSMKSKPKLQKSNTNLYPYGSGEPIDIVGTFETEIKSKAQKTSTQTTIYVARGNFGSLLSYHTAIALSIIPTIRVVSKSETDSIIEEYQDRFEGIGKIKDVQVKIHVNEEIQPKTQPHRRIPFHMRKKVEAEIKRLEDLDIIETVDGPTPWVSPIVVAPKPKHPEEIRICVDMRLPNEAVQRERHITPTIDDILVDLNGATVFSKLDLNSGYHQIELAPESRYLTTFTTHVGLRRYKRLIFGISSASEKFQATLRDCLNGIDGARNISDDIIIFGKDQESHDKRLRSVMQRLREKNITLNRSKCEFNKSEIEFFGYVFSRKGISADPKKVEAILNAESPSNESEVRSLLGLANYVSRFIPNFATITAPLRALTHKTVKWNWGKAEEESLEMLKEKLIGEAMTYFDPKKDTKIFVDASPVGLGAILTQDNKVIQYASKALTDVEKRYSQTEKEALAIVWGCEHFHLYLFGSPFVLVTDHKPLEVIFNNASSKPPARIERWRLRLQPYDFKVEYRPGKDNPADYMSRHPTDTFNAARHSKVAEEYLNFIVNHAVPRAMTLKEIAEATSKDDTIQEVIEKIVSGRWKEDFRNSAARQFVRVREELTVTSTCHGSILLHQSRIVIPTTLQQRVIDIAHEGHQGVVKTKQLLREKVWFPGINDMVENLCKSCIPCLASTPCDKREPLNMTSLPASPWTHVSADFSGPYPSGEYLLVIIDDYSRFPIVEIIGSTSARCVIPKFDKVFSEYGIPECLKTDNGPPFQSDEFKTYAQNTGFYHHRITPLWPRANGEAERFMRTIGKAIKAARTEGRNWKQEMYKFLRNYRATPHSSTGISPAQALFGRKMRTKLPELATKLPKALDIRLHDEQSKQKMKLYADQRASHSKIEPGDHVLVKTKRENKFSTPYDPTPYEVVNKKGTQITARRGTGNEHKITRNSSFFKKIEGGRGVIAVPEDLDTNQNMDEMFENNRLDDEHAEQAEDVKSKTQIDIPRRSQRRRFQPQHLKDFITN